VAAKSRSSESKFFQTRLCRKCSEETGGEFQITMTPENLAKAGSLKKNYGSFSMKKTRKPIRRKDR
jgi:hypothetical protein